MILGTFSNSRGFFFSRLAESPVASFFFSSTVKISTVKRNHRWRRFQAWVRNTKTSHLHEYLSYWRERDIYGYCRNETWPIYISLNNNIEMLKLKLYLSSFSHVIFYFLLQNWHFSCKIHAHRPYLVAKVAKELFLTEKG